MKIEEFQCAHFKNSTSSMYGQRGPLLIEPLLSINFDETLSIIKKNKTIILASQAECVATIIFAFRGQQ